MKVSDICNCGDGPWGNGVGGYNDGWREAMKFAHHAHTDENGRTSANGVLGSGPDCIIVDEDWLQGRLDLLEEFGKGHVTEYGIQRRTFKDGPFDGQVQPCALEQALEVMEVDRENVKRGFPNLSRIVSRTVTEWSEWDGNEW